MSSVNATGVNQFYISGVVPSANNLGDEYEKPTDASTKTKGKQILTGPVKRGTGRNWAASNHSAWPDPPRLLNEGDPYMDPGTIDREADKARRKKMPEKPWKSPNPPKKPAGPGNPLFGTFAGAPVHQTEFVVERRGVDRKKIERDAPKNFLVVPPARGHAGNIGLSIGKEGEVKYVSDPYDRKLEAERAWQKKHKDAVEGKKPFVTAKPKPTFAGDDIYKPVEVFKKKEKKAEEKKIERPAWRPSGRKKIDVPKFEYIEDPMDLQEQAERDERKAAHREATWKPLNTAAPSLPFRKIVP